MSSEQDLFNQLCYYTLSHQDPVFIHQYAVDAYAAQTADEKTKPVTIAFALAGLYLHNEKKYNGKEVQLAHMKLAQKKKQWPTFKLPLRRGGITIVEVMREASGPNRDKIIQNWSDSVWQAWKENHDQVAEWLKNDLKNCNEKAN